MKSPVFDKHKHNNCQLSTVNPRPRTGPLKKLLFALALLTSQVFAQQRPIVKYTVREGLVQNQVLSLLKDSRGYVWCGTWYGLSRFNGETFENYTESGGLWNSLVAGLVEDNMGFIWIISPVGGLARFDGRTFKKYAVPRESSALHFYAPTNAVRFYVPEQGLWEVKGETALPIRLPNFPEDAVAPVRYHAPTATYFFVQNKQVISYRDGEVTRLTDQGEWVVEATDNEDVHLARTFPNGNFQRYVVRQGQVMPFLLVRSNDYTLSTPLPYHYVFTSQNSLYYLPPNSLRAERIGESPPGGSGAAVLNQNVSSMLWIPTQKGLWGLMLTGFKNFRDDEVPYAWSVVEDHSGDFLFLNFGKGVQRYDGDQLYSIPKVQYHPAAIKAYKPLGISPGNDNWYYRALRDQNGYCWMPEGNGLYRYRDKKWDFIRKGGYNLAFGIAEDLGRKKIVVGSHQHFYTVSIDPPFRTDSIRNQSILFEGLILCTAVSPGGEYWFSGRGVDRYNPETKKFVSYTSENGKLPGKGVYMLYFDWNGTLWAGDKEILYRYNLITDRFEKAIDFKFHQIVQFAEQIDSTHLLIGDMKNLYVLNLKKFNATGEVEVKTFNHHNGFMGMEPGQLGSYRDSKGRIWITSASVLSVLDPKELDLTTRPLRTMISKVNQQGVSFIKPDELVEVPAGESIVNIKVETLGEDKPYNSQFSYWLDGVTDGWTDWQEQPVITLNNLSNGIHTLKVRSRSGDFNTYEASIATLHFSTKVALWKSPDFYKYASLVALLLVVALALLWRRDARKGRDLLAQQSQLEKRERTLRLLQAQTIQSQMNPHFTSNVLSAIQRQILDMDAESASDNLVKMSRLTRAYLNDSLLDKNYESFSTKDISLTREIKLLEMYVELQQLHYADRFDFALEVPPELDTNSYRLPPFLIQPFVENAIVHGLGHRKEKGLLRVQFSALPDEGLLCRIEDDGVGREAARLIQNKEPGEFTSVSTNLSQQRAALLKQLGYDIAIEITDLAQGTVVTIRIGYS